MNAVGFQSILILLGVAVVLIAVFRYLRLPQILAYLCAGILVGPHALGWVAGSSEWYYVAEFGLVFLMFTIGLEFSLPKLLAMKTIVFGVGGTQVLLSGAAFGLIAWWLGVPPEGAVVIGAILAMSSTAIVTKLLIDRLEQNTPHGRYAIGVLLFQDLAAVPFLILIPALGRGDQAIATLLAGVALKSALVLTAMIVIGRWVLRPMFHRVAATRLREHFVLTVLLLTLAAAWVTEAAGLSLALGAFLAGMMLGETEYRHQVEADILPFRDVLLGLFFVTVGMSLDLGVVRSYWLTISAAVAGVLALKAILIFAVGRLFRLDTTVALRTALILCQGGEFGFALAVLATQYRVLPEAPAQVVLATIALSMLIAPVIIGYNGPLARRLLPKSAPTRDAETAAIRADADRRANHVIICGYGRSGQNLSWMLEQEGIPRLAIDLDPARVRDARDAGKPVVYGDATRRDVLEAAGFARARALTISFNDIPLALKILEITRAERPQMPVIVRTMDDADIEGLLQAGATEVVPESLEGSLMMGSHMLLLLDVPPTRIDRYVREVRRNRYRMLRELFHGELTETPDTAWSERLHSITLPATGYAVHKKLHELDLDAVGVSVKAVRRDGREEPQPSPDTQLEPGDVLVLYGKPEALENAEEIVLAGK